MEMVGTSVQPADDEVNEKVETIMQRMKRIVEKVVPHPAPIVYVRVPFTDYDELTVEFRKPVPIRFLFCPNYSFEAYVDINLEETATALKMEFADGEIYSAELIDDNEDVIFAEPHGNTLLTYMLLPEIFSAARNANVYSKYGYAEKWFWEFVDAAEFVSQQDEVKQIDPIELLDREGRTEVLHVYIAKPVENLEGVDIELKTTIINVLKIDMYFHPEGEGHVECVFDDSGLRGVIIMPIPGVPEWKIRRYLTLLPEAFFDEAENSIRRFLEAYKVFRATISFMNL